MTDDLRERLRDLAGEMPELHAPGNLEGRAHRREAGVTVGVCLAALVIVVAAWAGIRSFDNSEPQVSENPAPFPVSETPVAATKALLQAPEGLMVDPSGNLFISEWYGNKVDALAPDGSLSVIAGTGAPGYGGDGGPATSAKIDSPTAMALEPDGSLLFVDNNNNCIRKIDTDGTISTVAGICGVHGYSGDGGQAIDARLGRPLGLVLDPNGGFYFSENDFGLVRHVDAAGQLSTIAGAGSVSPFNAGVDGVPASSLNLGRTSYLLLDPATRDLYVTDLRKDIIVKIDPSEVATVVAGTGQAGYSGDGGPATQAELNFPAGLAMDHRGNLYVADSNNNVIRMIDTNGVITTVVGTGTAGLAGDGGQANGARLSVPAGLAYANGMLYIADQQNDRVRRVDPNGVITTIAGS